MTTTRSIWNRGARIASKLCSHNRLATEQPTAAESTQCGNRIHRLPNQRRPLIDKARINLHQARACTDFLGSVLALGDATHCNDRQASRQFGGQHFHGMGALVPHWRTGQPARLVTVIHPLDARSEEHTSELQSLMRISYAVFCLKKKKTTS